MFKNFEKERDLNLLDIVKPEINKVFELPLYKRLDVFKFSGDQGREYLEVNDSKYTFSINKNFMASKETCKLLSKKFDSRQEAEEAFEIVVKDLIEDLMNYI